MDREAPDVTYAIQSTKMFDWRDRLRVLFGRPFILKLRVSVWLHREGMHPHALTTAQGHVPPLFGRARDEGRIAVTRELVSTPMQELEDLANEAWRGPRLTDEERSAGQREDAPYVNPTWRVVRSPKAVLDTFTCPRCGGHGWGTALAAVVKAGRDMGHCNTAGCGFTWWRDDDASVLTSTAGPAEGVAQGVASQRLKLVP